MDPITVTQLSQQIKRSLEGDFRRVTVTGELGNYRGPHHSGHVYCNLKDENAQVRLIIWRGTFERLKFRPEDGLEVVVTGKLDVYIRRGEYSLVASSMQPKGVGSLQLAFQQMYERLDREGLFDPQHKKPLPPYPQRIAVITSPTGAAIRDIITTAQRRSRLVEIFVYPAKVQGDGSAEQVARAIRKLNALNPQLRLDAIIVGRGGGSLEDLWAFNEEPVARAIFESEIPVVSAVGHEVDTTIADLVADVRAPTPTAAAEILVPELAGMEELVTEYHLRLSRGLRHTLEIWRGRLETMRERLGALGPINQLRREQQRLDYLMDGLKWSMHHRLKDNKGTLNSLGAHLEALSPLKVLERGYSITRNAKGKVIKKVGEVKKGETITTKLADGEVESEVTGPGA